MTNETDLDELSLLRHGYQRFLSGPGDFDDCDNAIITVRRQQHITTHFGPMTTKNRIKVSLSQEQILNQTNRFRPNMTRSQSINLQKSLVSPCGLFSGDFNMNRRLSIRPSMIPIKIKDQPKLRALTSGPNQDQNGKDSSKYRSVRKFSAPFGRRNYVLQQESTLPSLPMTQSLDPTMHLAKNRDAPSDLLDKFKCGICLNILSDSRVLNCLHTFCLECLYSIENVNRTKAINPKVNPMTRSNSSERNKIDMRSSNYSEENDKKVTKSSIASSTKPIRRIYTSTLKKRPDEPKVSHSISEKP